MHCIKMSFFRSLVSRSDPIRAFRGAAALLHQLHLQSHQPHREGRSEISRRYEQRLQVFPIRFIVIFFFDFYIFLYVTLLLNIYV